MIELYPKQKEAVDKLLTAFTDKKYRFTDRALFLSGEMGTGKTYMATSIIQQLMANDNLYMNTALIIAPSNVITHWMNVLKLTDLDVYKYKKNDDAEIFHEHDVVIASYAQLHSVIDTLKDGVSVASPAALGFDDEDTLVDNYVGMVVFDESQLIGKAACTYIDYLANTTHMALPMLFLSGTIFDANKANLANLLHTSNRQIVDHAFTVLHKGMLHYDDKDQLAFLEQIIGCLPIFVHFIWRYISVSIALDDVKNDSQLGSNIQQNILPINYIKLNEVQHAYYDLIVSRLHTLYGGDSEVKHGQVAADLIDMPTAAPLAAKYNRYAHDASENLLALPLQAINVNETIKFKELVKFLNSDDCVVSDKVLIYANNAELIATLATDLCAVGFDAISISANANPKTIEDKVNNSFKEHDIVIINPKQVTVGVDISAATLVWYQTLTTMTAILQAQRRITRLSSTKQATVKFLAYDETAQRSLLDEISDANKNNAAAYGYKDKSNLTKLTGILLADID